MTYAIYTPIFYIMIIFLQTPFLYSFLEESRDPLLSCTSFLITLDRKPIVMYPSLNAYKKGWRRGQSIRPESSIARIIPDRAFYRSAEESIISVLSTFSPAVEVSKNGFYLDVSGQELRFGSIQKLAGELFDALQASFKTPFFLGIGSNKLVAFIASGLLIPVLKSSFLYIPRYSEKYFMASLPVSLLPCIDREISGILSLLDIKHIRELALLPFSFLHQLFNDSGLKLYRYARGISDEPVSHPLSRNILFNGKNIPPANDIITIKTHIYSLLETACYRLKNMQRKSRHAAIYIVFEDHRHSKRHIRLKFYSCLETDFFHHINLGPMRRTNIIYLGLKFYSLIPSSTQQTLFAPPAEKKEKLLDVIFNIREKHGRDKLSFKSIN